MGRQPRVDVGGEYYHVLNRANSKQKIFKTIHDYETFIDILWEATLETSVNLLAFCVMPNHWHLLLQTINDGDLSQFMRWVTNTHVKRYKSDYNQIGHGHLYQGRYKSFVITNDNYLYTLLRYIERNALRANLVSRAEEWHWGSAAIRVGSKSGSNFLGTLPIDLPNSYLDDINKPLTESEFLSVKNYTTK
jgi:putative transposase